MKQHDELCRLPLLRTHFPAVNPLLSDTIDLRTRFKSKTSTICADLYVRRETRVWIRPVKKMQVIRFVLSLFSNAFQWAAMQYFGMVVS